MLHAARWKCRPKNHHLGTIAQICRAISSQLKYVSTIGKKLVKQQMSAQNMVNFGPLAAEIGLPVWGTPANFNSFRVLSALLHSSQVVGVSQTFSALNRGRHLYSAGRPLRWALAHILVLSFFFLLFSSPNLSGRRVSGCLHILLHMVWP